MWLMTGFAESFATAFRRRGDDCVRSASTVIAAGLAPSTDGPYFSR